MHQSLQIISISAIDKIPIHQLFEKIIQLVTHRETLSVDVDVNADGAGYGNTLVWPAGHGPGLGEQPVEVVFDVDVSKFGKRCVDAFTGPVLRAPLGAETVQASGQKP